MLKSLLFSTICVLALFGHGQIAFLTEDFEGASPWTATDDLLPNFWVNSTCYGNGPSAVGTSSALISYTGNTGPCGQQAAYVNSSSGTLIATYYTSVDATCYEILSLSFDYVLDISTGEIGQVVYSTDGGASWLQVGANLPSSGTWSTPNMALPGALDGTVFLLGFRFIYDAANVAGSGFIIDNVQLEGLDETVPPIVSCPVDTNVYVDANCNGIIGNYLAGVTAVDDCSLPGNILLSQSPVPGTIISGANIDVTVTITAVDEAGNSADCQFVARTLDTLVATIICPSDSTVYLNNACQYLLQDYTGNAIATDNCLPPSSLSISQSPMVGTTIVSPQLITLTVSGGFPAIDQSCTFTILPVDTISPSIICPNPSPLYVDALCETLLPDYSSSVIVSDNCGGTYLISQLPAAGSTLTGTGSAAITMTVVDAAGNSKSCTFNQGLLDTISPLLTCPGNQVEPADLNCNALLSNYLPLLTASDNCSSVLTYGQSPPAGMSISGNTTITLSATDVSGNSNSCTFSVGLQDLINPSITCPANGSLAADATCSGIVPDYSSVALIDDNCTPIPSLIFGQSPIAGSAIPLGTQMVSLTVSDAAGNSAQCTFSLLVEDLTAPTISCPPNQNLFADINCSAILLDYTSLVTASDNCSTLGALTVTQNPPSGTTILSDTPLTLQVNDANSNSTSCVFNVILVDSISPIVTCPGNQTLAINSNCEYTLPDLSSLITGSDNCSSFANMTISQNPAIGSLQSGTTSVVMTLLDEQSNSATCTITILPDDISPPSITCPTPAPVSAGTSCTYALPFYGSTALVLDNCSSYGITQIPAQGSSVNTGTNTIELTVTDAGGNSAQCTFDLVVFETIAPVITCPSSISGCNSLVTYSDPTFSDNCAASLSQTDGTGLSSGMSFPVGITTLEYTAVDSSGNMSTCNFTIEVLDFPAPANIIEDTIWLCDQSSLLLTADPISSGSGMWTIESGQANFNNQFANQTGVNNLGTGTTVFVWTVSSAQCGELSDTLVVVNTQMDIQASTQDTIITCAQAGIILQANTPLYGIGTWTSDGNAAITNIHSSNTTAFLNVSGWQNFVWTIENEGCPATSDTLKVLGNLPPDIFTPDTSVCFEEQPITLDGSLAPNGISTFWSSSNVDIVFSDPNSASTTVDNLQLGLNVILYSSAYPGCPTVSDTLEMIATLCEGFEPIFPTVITPNLDGRNDLFVINYLEKLYPECRVTIFNRWGSVVFESVGYADPWDGTFKGEPLPMGTYFYAIALNDDDGTVYRGDISIIH